MAKTFTATSSKKVEQKYPSGYGSHAVMVDQEMTARVTDPAWVVLKDDVGFYATMKNRLDSGLADPNRYASVKWKAELLSKMAPGVPEPVAVETPLVG